MAANAVRHLGNGYTNLAESVQRLSSGLRINGARDDAAGLAVRELMRADIAVFRQASRNSMDAISMLQTMEGAMATVDEALIRMKELAEQAATGTYSQDQRRIMNQEFRAMMDEINRISASTRFNDIAMLNNDSGAVSIHVGSDETIDVSKVNVSFDTGVQHEIRFGSMSDPANGVGSPEATWLSIKEAAPDNITMYIQFTGSSGANDPLHEMTVESSATVRDYSLREFVNTLNAQAGYELAEIAFDNGSGTYNLRLMARGDNMDSLQIGITGLPDGGDWVDGGFQVNGPGVHDGMAFMQSPGYFRRTVQQNDNCSLNLLNSESAIDALYEIQSRINDAASARAYFGYNMNRLEKTISVLQIQRENTLKSESRISDVDIASEMAELTRNQVLAEAGIAMLSHTMAIPQMALTLLR